MTSLDDSPIARRRFGRSDLVVSEFGLGCARIGGIFQRDPADFLNLLSVAFDSGINFFDTADIYSQGESEKLVGRAFRHRRDQVVIASKAGFVLPAQRRMIGRIKPLVRPLIQFLGLRRRNITGAVAGALAQDFSPSHLRRAVEGSLRRLATDRIDLFQLHSPSAEIIERGEWVDALDGLKRDGKIRYWGVSCDSVEAAAAALGHPGVSSLQIVVNLLEQGALDTLLRARAQGVAVIARECLANGLLAKELSPEDFISYCRSIDEAQRKAAQVKSYRTLASESGCSLPHLALQFVSRLESVSVSLIGVSRVEQLRALLSTGSLSAHRADLRVPGLA